MNKIEQTKRLFFSLVFTAKQQQQLLPYQRQVLALCPQARAVDSSNLHLTLFFLGQTDAQQQQQLLDEAKAIRVPCFSISLDTLAGFTGPKIAYLAPSVIPAALTQLQQQLATLCKAKGFVDLFQQYQPHVTLARHTMFDEDLAVAPLMLFVDAFALYVSENSNGKVQYRPLHIIKLT